MGAAQHFTKYTTTGTERHVCLGRFRLSHCVFHSEHVFDVQLSPQPTIQSAGVLSRKQRARRVPACCNALLPKLPPSELEDLSASTLRAAKALYEELRASPERTCPRAAPAPRS